MSDPNDLVYRISYRIGSVSAALFAFVWRKDVALYREAVDHLRSADEWRTRALAAEESARNWEATCRDAYADAGSAEFAERTYSAALQQIKAVCEDNAQASRPDLALKFILDVVMKTLHGEPSADPEAL